MLVTAIFAFGRGGVVAAEQGVPALLDPVVVSATRSAERAFDLPVAIDTVTSDQIQRG
jgi:outer membrane receptor protein involved in Fe transport